MPPPASLNRSAPSRVSSSTRVRTSIACSVLGWRPSACALRRSLRRRSICPQRSGAGSVKALNRGRSVWNGPGAGGRTGSMPKASRRDNHDRSYSKEAVCLAPRARAQSVPTGTVSPSSSMKTRISRAMSGTRGSWPYRTDTPRQPFFFQAQPDRVPGGVHHVTEPIRHPQHEEHRGVDAHRHAGITLLHPHERGAMKARSAMRATGIRLRLRAADRSMPSFRRARRTLNGSAC